MSTIDFTVKLEGRRTGRKIDGHQVCWHYPFHDIEWHVEGVRVILAKATDVDDLYWITTWSTTDEDKFPDRGPYTKTQVITLLRLQGNTV